MPTGLLYDERFLSHDSGRGHPERKERLIRTIDHLRSQPWFDQLIPIKASVAPRSWLQTVHDDDYIDRAAAMCAAGHSWLDSVEVGISTESATVARIAVGGALAMADAVVARQVTNAFALCRPPGHHAEYNQALGFCMFNNVAVLARYLQRQYGLDKILILDWDVHHGNGTQHSFEEDPSVLYVSTHQYPYYPGTGAVSEIGHGRGQGATVNCPMPAGADDAMYERAFRDRILPAIAHFAPEAVILSAGFDAHHADPLAQVNLSTDCFRWMTARMLEIADRHAQGRLISLLEGGYNVDVLPHCIAAHLEELMKA